jgi:hypothetical protein
LAAAEKYNAEGHVRTAGFVSGAVITERDTISTAPMLEEIKKLTA